MAAHLRVGSVIDAGSAGEATVTNITDQYLEYEIHSSGLVVVRPWTTAGTIRVVTD